MILVPKLNIFSKKTKRQDKDYRRLKLLGFVGMPFWDRDDFALAGYYDDNVMRAVSSMPYGVTRPAGGDTLTLNALASNDFDATAPYSSQVGVRFLRDGHVQELSAAGSWVNQNAGVEWIDNNASDIGDDYECQLDTGTNTGSLTGPTINSYHTISTTRQWTYTRTSVGSLTISTTGRVREIADTGNNVSASVIMFVENGI